jgi:hypothetical protein
MSGLLAHRQCHRHHGTHPKPPNCIDIAAELYLSRCPGWLGTTTPRKWFGTLLPLRRTCRVRRHTLEQVVAHSEITSPPRPREPGGRLAHAKPSVASIRQLEIQIAGVAHHVGEGITGRARCYRRPRRPRAPVSIAMSVSPRRVHCTRRRTANRAQPFPELGWIRLSWQRNAIYIQVFEGD